MFHNPQTNRLGHNQYEIQMESLLSINKVSECEDRR